MPITMPGDKIPRPTPQQGAGLWTGSFVIPATSPLLILPHYCRLCARSRIPSPAGSGRCIASGRSNSTRPTQSSAWRIVHLTAHAEDPDLARSLEPLLQPEWNTRWAAGNGNHTTADSPTGAG